MDLERVKKLVDGFKLAPPEQQSAARHQAKHIEEYIRRDLAALPDTDLACVAWYVAQIFGGLSQMPVSEISDTLDNSLVAYGVCAAKLLGWMPDD